jgi:hypothetical protein
MARRWEFEPKTRSTRVAVHLASPVARSRPVVGVQDPHATDQDRHLGHGQRQHVSPVHQRTFRWLRLSGLEIVAEPICLRLQHGERLYVSLFLRGVRVARCEWDSNIMPGVLRGLLDGRASAVRHGGSGFALAGQLIPEVAGTVIEGAGVSEPYQFLGGYPTPETVARAYAEVDLSRAVSAYRFF